MPVSPIQGQPNRGSFGHVSRPRVPRGLAETPDRLENWKPPASENPPSLFKEFLFRPLFSVVKLILRGIFTLVDFLRRSAFDERPLESRDQFLDRLHAVPHPEKLLRQFTKVYSVTEQNRVYRAIGKAHTSRTSFKGLIWERSSRENIELGRRLVRENPFILRDHIHD